MTVPIKESMHQNFFLYTGCDLGLVCHSQFLTVRFVWRLSSFEWYVSTIKYLHCRIRTCRQQKVNIHVSVSFNKIL
jgi:hypothetical protein